MTTELRQREPHVFGLPDGRRLSWYEFGEAEGIPCIYSAGTPVSGLGGFVYDRPARQAGIRWISVDRPGYGHSDYMPRRRLLDYPTDIEALADHLELAHFAAVGESGGGPYALALARAMPHRLTSTAVLAGMGPGHKTWVRRNLKPQNRRLLAVAGTAPWLLWIPLSHMGHQLADPQRSATYARRQLAVSPTADRVIFEADAKLLELSVAAGADAFRSGARGAVREMALLARPWGFELDEVRTHVDLWHGTDDVSVPVAVARHVAHALPDCSARIVEGAGHAVGLQQADEMLSCIAQGRDQGGVA